MVGSERPEPNFSDSQRRAFEQAVEKAAIEWVRRTELRKWAIEKAAQIWNIPPKPRTLDGGTVEFIDPILLAKGIYDFVRNDQ